MNKKGFTLVEVLAVIVILGILSSFVVPSVFKMIKNAKENSFNTLIDSIEENAKLYVSRHRDEVENYLDSSNYYSLTLNDLKTDNLLKTPITDPRTDIEIPLTKKIYVARETDQTLSVCYEDRGCYAPTLLVSKITDASNIVSGTVQGLHHDTTNNFYYYAGSNPNNWVEFNGYLWRIVKVNSDSTIKLIFEGTKTKNGTTQNGSLASRTFDDSNTNSYNNAVSIRTYLLDWYNNNITDINKAKVQGTQWCIKGITYSTTGVSKSSFLNNECTTKTASTYAIGLLSGSEYLYASLDATCLTAYKTASDYGYSCMNQNYLYKNSYNYWTVTPDGTGSGLWTVNSVGSLGAPIPASNSSYTRPVINLKSDVYIDRGNGSFDTPYTVKDIISVDKEGPAITLNGSNPTSVQLGSTYTDAGATASDNVDGDLTSKIIALSNVDVNHIGTYKVTYVVSDVSGNKTSVSRTVNVVLNVELLVVAGGGGGSSGGGGAGGLIYNSTYTISSVTTSVIVGAGGTGGNANGTNCNATSGDNSVFGDLTAIGGGAGGCNDLSASAKSGGSGGGGGSTSTVQNNGGTGTVNQGYAGGTVTSTYFPSPFPSAGGGGAGGVGAGPTNSTTSGNGGIGLTYSISGTSTYYAGGGGGSTWGGGTHGTGGSSVGGAGGCPNGIAAVANTGSGGGGGCGGSSGIGGNGASGIIIVKYLGSAKATGGTITTNGGYTIHTFTSGTYTFVIQ